MVNKLNEAKKIETTRERQTRRAHNFTHHSISGIASSVSLAADMACWCNSTRTLPLELFRLRLFEALFDLICGMFLCLPLGPNISSSLKSVVRLLTNARCCEIMPINRKGSKSNVFVCICIIQLTLKIYPVSIIMKLRISELRDRWVSIICFANTLMRAATRIDQDKIDSILTKELFRITTASAMNSQLQEEPSRYANI